MAPALAQAAEPVGVVLDVAVRVQAELLRDLGHLLGAEGDAGRRAGRLIKKVTAVSARCLGEALLFFFFLSQACENRGLLTISHWLYWRLSMALLNEKGRTAKPLARLTRPPRPTTARSVRVGVARIAVVVRVSVSVLMRAQRRGEEGEERRLLTGLFSGIVEGLVVKFTQGDVGWVEVVGRGCAEKESRWVVAWQPGSHDCLFEKKKKTPRTSGGGRYGLWQLAQA